MDLKIQRSCGLTTSQLKGSGFGFPQSDPHCALCRSTAAVVPASRGYAEAVMTLHFFELPVIKPLEEGKSVHGPAVMAGRGNGRMCDRGDDICGMSELGTEELCSVRVLGY